MLAKPGLLGDSMGLILSPWLSFKLRIFLRATRGRKAFPKVSLGFIDVPTSEKDLIHWLPVLVPFISLRMNPPKKQLWEGGVYFSSGFEGSWPIMEQKAWWLEQELAEALVTRRG